jgi:pilus assembly protein CpaE
MPVVRTFVAVDSSVDRTVVQEALPASAGDIEILGVINGLEDSWNALQEAPIDLLAVACGGHSDRVLYFIESALKQRPERPIVVLAENAQNGFVRRVFEAGADDVVSLPEAPDRVAFVFQKAVARRDGAAAASGIAQAPMICVLGPKGGTGKTLTASNLAVAMALAGDKVALVDLDLQFGDIGLALGLSPQKTIYDLAKSGGSVDVEKLETYMTTHVSGVQVLLAPTRPDQASFVTVDLLRDVFTLLRSSYGVVIVDTPPGFTPEVIASIDISTHLCMVGMLDSLSLKNTKLGLETLQLMGYDDGRVSLLLNRSDSRMGITEDDVETILGRAPDVLVPSGREVARSMTDGVPIVLSAERSEASQAFRKLAASYTGPAAAPSQNGAGEPPDSKSDKRADRAESVGRVRQLIRRQ